MAEESLSLFRVLYLVYVDDGEESFSALNSRDLKRSVKLGESLVEEPSKFLRRLDIARTGETDDLE